jgi:hypothetical protein
MRFDMSHRASTGTQAVMEVAMIQALDIVTTPTNTLAARRTYG